MQGKEWIFTNLIVNAIKYGNENGTIEVRFFDMDKYILVEVSDDGVGIAKKHFVSTLTIN